MKNTFLFMALLVVLVGVMLSGCAMQSAPLKQGQTGLENKTNVTQQNTTVVENETQQQNTTQNVTQNVTQNTTNVTNATQNVTQPTQTYAAKDCSILTVDDFKSICNEPNVVATVKSEAGKVCAIEFGVKTGDGTVGPIGRWMTVEVSAGTEAQVMGGITACKSFGTPVGTTGCRMGRGAIIAKGNYLVGFTATTTMTPEQWLCSEEQVTQLIQLVQSR